MAPPYEIEFYEDANGEMPVLRWPREELTPQKRRALGTAMSEILQYDGPNVAQTNFGDTLGDGLFEFRLDQDVAQILARKGQQAKARDRDGDEKILLRVFFHPYGSKLLLLLGGYDKAEHSSHSYQQSQIGIAKSRLTAWKEEQKRAARAKPAKKSGGKRRT